MDILLREIFLLCKFLAVECASPFLQHVTSIFISVFSYINFVFIRKDKIVTGGRFYAAKFPAVKLPVTSLEDSDESYVVTCIID